MNASITAIGLMAQGFYTARSLVQWIATERNRQVESPLLFWVFSLCGSVLLFIYGYLREDFSIIFGELISYYIYIWNLKANGFAPFYSKALTLVFACFPMLIGGIMIGQDTVALTHRFFLNGSLPAYVIIWGTVGQLIYKMRFVYQWYYSYRHHQSSLPIKFWLMALVGSLMIIAYGIYRQDVIIVIGQTGIIATIRNIIIWHECQRTENPV